MEVEAPNTADSETPFSLQDAKGNKDVDAETAKDGHTNDKARPETSGVEPETTDGEAQAGSKRTHDAAEEENPIDAFARRTVEAARRIKENKKSSVANHSQVCRGSGWGTKAFTSETQGRSKGQEVGGSTHPGIAQPKRGVHPMRDKGHISIVPKTSSEDRHRHAHG